METISALPSKLTSFYDGLGEYEQHCLHLLMSVAVGGASPEGEEPTEETLRSVWRTGLSVLSHINPSGLSYVGRAEFLDDGRVNKLLNEASIQAAIAHRTGPQELAPGGSEAIALANDPGLQALVEASSGLKVAPTNVTSYLYYNKDGDHLYPHVDTEAFAINCIIMLSHERPSAKENSSALLVWDKDFVKKRIHLDSGEFAILLASGTVHARERITNNEKITLLTIGFSGIAP